METKADVGVIDLNVLTLAVLLLRARAPGDHPVGTRIDRCRRHQNGFCQPAYPFGSRRVIFLPGEQLPNRADIGRTWCQERTSERNDHADVIRNLTRDLTRAVSATAPADKANLQAGVLTKLGPERSCAAVLRSA